MYVYTNKKTIKKTNENRKKKEYVFSGFLLTQVK